MKHFLSIEDLVREQESGKEVVGKEATAGTAPAEMTAEPFDDDLANERNDRTGSAT